MKLYLLSYIYSFVYSQSLSLSLSLSFFLSLSHWFIHLYIYLFIQLYINIETSLDWQIQGSFVYKHKIFSPTIYKSHVHCSPSLATLTKPGQHTPHPLLPKLLPSRRSPASLCSGMLFGENSAAKIHDHDLRICLALWNWWRRRSSERERWRWMVVCYRKSWYFSVSVNIV